MSLLHKASARRLRQLCQSNAGIYIKAAQLLSIAQAVPSEYRKCVSDRLQGVSNACCPALALTVFSPMEAVFGSVLRFMLLATQSCGWRWCCICPCRRLEVLQDRAEPRGFEEVQQAVMQQLGAPIEELFAEFEPQARAAASLAQACFLCLLMAHFSLCGANNERPSHRQSTMIRLAYLCFPDASRVPLGRSVPPRQNRAPKRHECCCLRLCRAAAGAQGKAV